LVGGAAEPFDETIFHARERGTRGFRHAGLDPVRPEPHQPRGRRTVSFGS